MPCGVAKKKEQNYTTKVIHTVYKNSNNKSVLKIKRKDCKFGIDMYTLLYLK